MFRSRAICGLWFNIHATLKLYGFYLDSERCHINNVFVLSKNIVLSGIFLAILGRGPRAFLTGKISDINHEFGKFSEYSKLIIVSKLTLMYLIKLMHLDYLIIA